MDDGQLVGSRIRTRLRFSVGFDRDKYGPVFVATRNVCDIQQFPADATSFSIENVVESDVRFGERVVSYYTPPFAELSYALATTEAGAAHYADLVEIPVLEALKGKVWVFSYERRERAVA